jgi:putative transposase
MPRANRTYLPGLIWHITHRCHDRAFLLKNSPDKREWKRWISESKKRYGLRVLDYAITDNHIHLLAEDRDPGSSIASSMQLSAGCTAQRHNSVHSRRGAFWEDRYHATAVETGNHLLRCICYIDLNMVRAGVVSHPADWQWGGYQELQGIRMRYRLVDIDALLDATGASGLSEFRKMHAEMINKRLQDDRCSRDGNWSSSVAVGSADFVQTVQERLGHRSGSRQLTEEAEHYVLREPSPLYGVYGPQPLNSFVWNEGEGPCFIARFSP